MYADKGYLFKELTKALHLITNIKNNMKTH
ncbi:MAG: transposase [Cytophagales bacterium]|nr:transposase [Cytophagales bacterium]